MINKLSNLRRLAVGAAALLVILGAGISTPFTPNTAPSLLILGDSITWGTEYFAKSQKLIVADTQWTNIVIDGQYSRRVAFPTPNASTKYSGVKTFKKLSNGGLKADAVIVALGSNDVAIETKKAVYETVIRDLLTTIGNIPITWLTVNRRDTPAIAKRSVLFNRVLVRIAPEYPNLVIEDWYSKIAKRPKWMAWDKVHLTPKGYQARAKLHQRLARELYDRHIIATTPTTTTTTTVPPTETTTPTTVAP
ncbi:MAG: GDSL-type esterase/lipase family protein [Actinobacteria bacterium]|nr:GDSL-type esterase/lipase family protein [Actinomycetota bacterium]